MPLQNTTSDAISSCVEYVQSVPNIFLTTNSNFESKTVMSTTSSNSRSFAFPRSSVIAAHSNISLTTNSNFEPKTVISTTSSNSRSFAFPRFSVSAAHSNAISSRVEYVQSVPNISLTTNSNFEPKTVMSTTHNSRRSFAFPRSSVSAAHSNFDSDQFHSEFFKQPVTNNSRSNRVHFNDLSDSFNHFYIQPNVSRPSANYNFSIPMTNSSSQSAHFPHFTPPYPPVGSFINPFQNQQLPLEVLSRHLLQQDLLKKAVEPFDGTAIKFWPWFTKMEGFIQELNLSPLNILQLLESHCKGSPQRYISDRLAATCEVTETEVQHTVRGLITRFGSTQKITSELFAKIDAFPAIRGSNCGDQLNNLYDLCCIISYNMRQCPELQAFHLASGLKSIRSKLPEFLQNEWRRCGQRHEDEYGHHPPFPTFIDFLDRQARQFSNRNYETLASDRTLRNVKAFQTTLEVKPKAVPEDQLPVSSNSSKFCHFHKASTHTLADCKAFRKLKFADRKALLSDNKLCYKCLGNHMVSKCTTTVTCTVCGRNHLAALHRASEAEISSAKQLPEPAHTPVTNSLTMCTKLCGNLSVNKNCSKTLLVELTMEGLENKSLQCYAIVDEQSNTTLVDEYVVEYFGREFPQQNYSMKFASQSCELSSSGSLVTGLRVRGVREKEIVHIPQALSCTDIADTTHEVATPHTVRSHPSISHFAKHFPKFNPKAKVLILIGRNVGRAMATRCVTSVEPYLHQTPLGYALVGNTCLPTDSLTPISVLKTAVSPLNPVEVKISHLMPKHKPRFDTFASKPDDDLPGLSQNDKKFLDIASSGLTVTPSGNIEIPLPLKSSNIPDNKAAVYMRTKATLTRLKSQPEKLHACIESMSKNLSNGFVEEIPPDDNSSSPSWYLPIFCVTHPQKKKVRLVFDAAARFRGTTLNDLLLQGPDLCNDLRGVLFRFRERPIAVGADIESMFSNFKVPQDQSNLQRFFWFKNNDSSNSLVHFRATSHVFGCTSSPAVANFAMKFLASLDLPDDFQRAKDYLHESFYVDDGLTSTNTSGEAIDTLQKARKILSKFNIRLHKITSNDPDVLKAIPSSELASEIPMLPSEASAIQAALGVLWKTSSDVLEIRTNSPEKPFTKRGVLSTVNSLFDPLGIMSPVILKGRLLQRKILSSIKSKEDTSSDVDWDDPLPDVFRTQWNEWVQSLTSFNKLQIPRSFLPMGFQPVKQELHIFCDASDDAIGYVAYLKSVDSHDSAHIAFVTSASKVAPRSATTIPRLELCAALEATMCGSTLMRELKNSPSHLFFYSDSQIVLGYLSNTQKRFSKYIERRVSIVLQHSQAEDWSYVKSLDNPADIATRTHTPDQLLASMWFTGPQFLKEAEASKSSHLVPTSLPEEKIEVSAFVLSETCASLFESLCKRFNCLNKILRIISKVLKFCSSFSRVDMSSSRESALSSLIRDAQSSFFSTAIKMLSKSEPISENDPLSNLSPFIDSQNVLRVGGRLKKANIPFCSKHPALIPNKHPLANIIIAYCHKLNKHQGAHLSHAAVINEGFHIQGGKRLVQNFIKSCILCKKLRGLHCEQFMADLPSDRLDEIPPFSNVGLDVFGPFYIYERSTRSTPGGRKIWAVIFVCLPSRAVHLEPLPSMDTTTFRNALTRFFAIRGHCRLIRSDCGSNFLGARNQMSELNIASISKELEDRSIRWEMNPPHASHFGGAWERKIGSIRRILEGSIALMGPRRLSFDEFSTVLAEASQILNNTPLWGISADPNDPTPLTPAMLLTLRDQPNPPPLETFSERDLITYDSRRYRRVQYLSDQFWIRWRKEFLHTLTKRHKWRMKKRCISIGDIVLVRDQRTSRNHWPMARVTAVKRSDDNLVRSVTLALPSLPGSLKPRMWRRPVSELVLLVPDESHSCPANPASERQDGGGVSSIPRIT